MYGYLIDLYTTGVFLFDGGGGGIVWVVFAISNSNKWVGMTGGWFDLKCHLMDVCNSVDGFGDEISAE